MPKPAAKPVIAIDVDDVLAMHADAFVRFSNKRWGTHLKVGDYTDHWVELWGIEEKEMKKRLNEYHSAGSYRNYETVPNSQAVLRKLAKKHKLVVLTARQQSLSADTTVWIKEKFGNVISEIHFAGIWDKPSAIGAKMTKTEYAQSIGADYLIEDQLKYVLPAAEAGIKTLLFGDYSWNQLARLPKGVTRVKDWSAVLEYFDAESRRTV